MEPDTKPTTAALAQSYADAECALRAARERLADMRREEDRLVDARDKAWRALLDANGMSYRSL